MKLIAEHILSPRSSSHYKKVFTFLCMLIGGLYTHAQDCSELKDLSDDIQAKLTKYVSAASPTETMTAEYSADYASYKAALFAYIDKVKNHDMMLKTAAQIFLRDESLNFMIEMRKLGKYEEAYREFLFSKKMISDNIEFEGPYRAHIECDVGSGKQLLIYADDYRQKNATFYSMGLDLAYRTNRINDALQYFIYLHNNGLFGAWHTHLNPFAEMIFKNRYATGIIDDTCFIAAFHFLETYKDRSITGFLNTETRDHAIAVVTDKKFEKLQVPRAQNPDDDKFYADYPRYYLKLYAVTQPDSLNFSDDVQTSILTRLLIITKNYKKGISFTDFYSAFIARGGGGISAHAQRIMDSRNAELIELLADFFFENRRFNSDIAVLAALFYLDRGNKQMAKKSLKVLDKSGLAFYREHYPRLGEL